MSDDIVDPKCASSSYPQGLAVSQFGQRSAAPCNGSVFERTGARIRRSLAFRRDGDGQGAGEGVLRRKDLRRPHIIQLLGVVFEQASPLPVLVMERLTTSLRRFLEDHTKAQFPLSRKAVVLHQVSLGLAYLHSLKYIHRDLSTNNILLDTETWKAAKITDFGVTRVLDTTRSRMTGTFVPGACMSVCVCTCMCVCVYRHAYICVGVFVHS